MAAVLTTNQQKKIGNYIADAQAEGHKITDIIMNGGVIDGEDKCQILRSIDAIQNNLTKLYYMTDQDR